jgi:hypothetical protein
MSSISNEIHAKILDQFYQDVSAVDRLRKEKARLNVHHPNQNIDRPEEIEETEKEKSSNDIDKEQNKSKEEEKKI